MPSESYDLVVVGAGAAALGAARAARRLDKSVAIVSDGPVGGDCTFTGCVPSKTLIAQARAGASFDDAMAAVGEVVARIAATEDASALAREGIDVVEGRGRLADARSVEAADRRLTASKIAIATGAKAIVPPIPGLEGAKPLTSDTVWGLERCPDRLGILGGGPIGCELAQSFARLGVSVTLYEALDRLLTKEEPEASVAAERALRDDGVDLRLGTRVERVELGAGTVDLVDEEGGSVGVDRVLVATGRRPTTMDLGLERLGVATDEQGHIVTDDRLRTNVDGVYAIGDVTGKLPFTHAADEMGRLAVGFMFSKGPRWRFDPNVVPWVTFVDPEIARVGLTEAEAASKRGARVAYLPLDEIDRSRTDAADNGFIKIITAPRRFTRGLFGGRVVGATIVAPHAGETIHELALAVRTGMFTGRLGQLVHAYPTYSTGVQQTIAQFFYEFGGRSARPASRQ